MSGTPPVTATVAPAMQLAWSDASNTYAGASSAGCPGRWNGTCLPNSQARSMSSVQGMSGVQTGPGATQFTRMPLSSSS